MAKVLVSIPDALLEKVDARVKAAGQTRSGYLRRLAEHDLEKDEQRGRERTKQLMDLIRADFAREGAGEDAQWVDAAQLIREDRESH